MISMSAHSIYWCIL